MPDPFDITIALAAKAGLSLSGPPIQMAGGRNNRVFRIGETAVLKLYHHDPRDPRDRLRAEWAFIRHAWDRGVRTIPRPLACDAAAHAALYGFLPGRKLTAGEIGPIHIDAALGFLRAIDGGANALDPGSEACFSIAEHHATIERRVARLEALAAPPLLVTKRLRPVWDTVRGRPAGYDVDRRVTACVSPSDFGFHNALVDGDRIGFIDFEYAGRDDPAKLVCDFFCQPEVPVPLSFMPTVIKGLGLAADDAARCVALLDAYRVKWACIVLNDLLPVDAARRSFADVRRSASDALRQAETKLDEIGRM